MSSDSSTSSESESDSRTQSSDSKDTREVNGNKQTHITVIEPPGLSNTLDTYVYENTAPGPRYRRGRGRSFFKQSIQGKNACQVPGCDRPIEKMKEYYKRYKICPYHMEANFLLVEGQKIRFCQQCGRFQLLSEFDGEKRSCRKRLARHNRRRRKSEADGGRISREDQGPSRENDDKATPNPLNNTAHGLVNSALENVLEAMRVDGLFETPNAAEVKVRALVALVELQQALEELSHDRSQSQSQDTHGRQSLPPDTLKHTMAKLLQQKQVPVLKTSAMGPPPIQQLGFPGFSKAPPLNSQAVDAQISAHLMQNFPPLNPAQLMHFQQQAAMAQSLASPMSARCGDSKQGIPPHDGTCPSESFPDKLNILLETLKQASNK